MPVYPCLKCNSPVDPMADKACRNCREQKCLECSRCQKRVSTEEVYDREKLKTKKPIFCLECGEREAVVKCSLCKLSLQRHQAKQVTPAPHAPLYHPHCLAERQKQMDRLGQLAPLMLLVGAVVGGLVGYTYAKAVGVAIGAAVLGGLFFAIVNGLRNIMSPK